MPWRQLSIRDMLAEKNCRLDRRDWDGDADGEAGVNLGEHMQSHGKIACVRLMLGMLGMLCALVLAGCAATPPDTGGQPPEAGWAGNGCSPVEPPEVDVNLKVIGPNQDQKFSIAELTKRHILGEAENLPGTHYTLGVTEADAKGGADMNIRGKEQPGGDWCIHATKVTLNVNWHIDVHLGTELIPGSCLYQAVQQHESKHVARDREMMPLLEQQLKKIVARKMQIQARGASISATEQKLLADLDESLKPILKAFVAERNRRQLEIDTREEYERVQASCPETELRTAVLGKTS